MGGTEEAKEGWWKCE